MTYDGGSNAGQSDAQNGKNVVRCTYASVSARREC